MPEVTTKTKTQSQLVVATAVLALSFGAAAFAAFGLPKPSERLYSTVSVTCHDGSRLIADQYIETVYQSGEVTPQVGPGIPCLTSSQAQRFAAGFCQGKQNPMTRKTGVNSFSISGRCEQPPQTPRYGDGYGYGYGYPKTIK